MSDPYNNQYPQQNQYGNSPAPSGGYGAPPYNQQPQGDYNQGYPQHHQQQQQQGYNGGYGSPAASDPYGPPPPQDAYGPPATGGFQHGYDGGQFGSYDASNPQGNAGYYGQQQYPPQGQQNYDQQQMQQYQGQQNNQQFDPNNPNNQGQYRDPNAPAGTDFNAPNAEGADGERGLGSALAGGAAGYFLGKKKNHGLLGAVGGAIVGNFVGNKFKDSKHGHGGSNHGSSFGGSSWGGGKW